MTVDDLEQFKDNRFSQSGEDGLVEEILRRISVENSLNRWCCEFGAWDGLHYSNTAKLIRGDGYKAVLIEGDPLRVKDLKVNFPGDSVTAVCSFVTPAGKTSLDNILSDTDIPIDFDFLSIDIDGNDYWILESLKNYQPKLISIEFNPSIPNVVSFVQDYNPQTKHGSSALAISELARIKGYTVVAATMCNLLLVRNNLLSSVVSISPALEQLIPHCNDPIYMFFGYDGTVLTNSSSVLLPWHGLFPTSKIQILPKFLRIYSGDYNFFHKLVYRFFYFSTRPGKIAFVLDKIKSK